MVDVLVVGGGPAGRAAAAACSDTGLRVALLDPKPRRGWPATYGSWRDEVPGWLPESVFASVMHGMRAVGSGEHELHRRYAIMDNTALWKQLWRADILEIEGMAAAVEHGRTGSTVTLRDGRTIAAAVVVDASGMVRALSGGRPRRTPAQQTAVGVVVPSDTAAGVVAPGRGLLMDWRQPSPGGANSWPTFLYGVRLGEDRVLLEETSLARRPGLSLALLRRRLRARLADTGIAVDHPVRERVRFAVDDPIPLPGRTVPFGAAAGLVHPATGYCLAASLRRAPWLAAGIAAGLSRGPAVAARSAWSMVWPPRALATQAMRRRALGSLLSFPPEEVPAFFQLFFTLEPHHQVAFLSSDADVTGTVAAMRALFRRAPWPMRRRLMLGGLGTMQRAGLDDLGDA